MSSATEAAVRAAREALLEADKSVLQARLVRAKGYLDKAVQAGKRDAVEFWKDVISRTQAQLQKADAPFGPPEDDGPEPEEPAEEPKDGADDDAPEVTIEPPEDDETEPEKAADDEGPEVTIEPPDDSEPAKGDGAAPDETPGDKEHTVDPEAEGVDTSGLSDEEKKLVENAEHRKEEGAKVADQIGAAIDTDTAPEEIEPEPEGEKEKKPEKKPGKQPEKKGGGFFAGVKKALGGVAGAFGAIGKWAGGAVSALDTKVLGRAAGTMTFALVGGLAFGGIGALAGMALSHYFAQKGALSDQGESAYRAAQRALLLAEQGKGSKKNAEDAVDQWMRHIAGSIRDGFANLDKVPPDELAAILKAARRYKKDVMPPKGGD